MSVLVALEGKKREAVGKGSARSIRREGFIPAIVYSGQKDPVMFSLPEKELVLLYNKHGFMSHLYELKIDGHNHKALVKHIQLHPVTDKIEHIDFIHVSEGSKIKVMVSIEFTNKELSLGIKRGGVLNVNKFDIEIECNPNLIPEQLNIDVSNLNIGESIHAKDLILPAGVVTTLDPDTTICAMVGRVEDSEVAAPAEAAPKA